MCLSVRNRLPNHAYYGDEAFAGDSVGLGLGQRLNSIFKKLISRYFWGKIEPDVKNHYTSSNELGLISVRVKYLWIISNLKISNFNFRSFLTRWFIVTKWIGSVMFVNDLYFQPLLGPPKGKAWWRDWTYFRARKRELEENDCVIAWWINLASSVIG